MTYTDAVYCGVASSPIAAPSSCSYFTSFKSSARKLLVAGATAKVDRKKEPPWTSWQTHTLRLYTVHAPRPLWGVKGFRRYANEWCEVRPLCVSTLKGLNI
jgi:hypothetical protein